MATASQDRPPTFRRDSPSPEIAPTRAIGASPELSRCLSSTSMASQGSATTDGSRPRESLGAASDTSNLSRHSSASFASSSRLSDVSGLGVDTGSRRSCSGSRYSTMSMDRPAAQRSSSRRRGYMRPCGTDFAASARQRESVLSLGSITHLQYYFARTGLLDGKGGNLGRRRNQKAQTLDFSQLDTSAFKKTGSGSDVDSSYASLGSSPDLGAQQTGLVESPIREDHIGDEAYFDDDVSDPEDYDGAEHGMLPPTTSTYVHREKPVPKPPSMSELRAELTSALETATKALIEAKEGKDVSKAEDPEDKENNTPSKKAPGWFEVQGVHILDVMTLAIRAAKVYYTSHEHPHKLDAIKSEKAVRAELLSVMDALKRMASRNFAGGIREDEFATMDGWVAGLKDMLSREDEMVAAERKEVASWTWLKDNGWSDSLEKRVEREYAFIKSLLAGNGSFPGQSTASTTPTQMTSPTATSFPGAASSTTTAQSLLTGTATTDEETLPEWKPIDRNTSLDSQTVPTPFLRAMQNGKFLVRLHNGAVHKSQRRFGAIGSYHQDTAKPYRSADNIRYWVKAAELRWEVHLKGVDPLALVYDNVGPQVWVAFEDAILDWCRKVREEITAELVAAGLV
ncbi:hypothetical protein MCOR25_006888 [Pyricularia grisea]|uniref:Uncharacterized protein n=1 Tax=Pyricularia grisea TaxID=148305 RepID=A0A6P8B811_PYRGI|nr:uncharacterized protein PgNI_03236 [Pyricularia grisea]KAI6359946.1 hypothetical protein MCOR25_006888 [Pyricularia grisea]TLD12009.1 hypothetical protein PgNI_03236 [Pyricularia grisea]